jgi:hypothetical protein
MADIESKICTKCGELKTIDKFYKYLDPNTNTHKYKPSCIECKRNYDIKKRNELYSGSPEHQKMKGAIRKLSQEEFDEIKEKVKNGCSISDLSRLVGCTHATAKKYLENNLFN